MPSAAAQGITDSLPPGDLRRHQEIQKALRMRHPRAEALQDVAGCTSAVRVIPDLDIADESIAMYREMVHLRCKIVAGHGKK